jgi:cation:H+ antiporter
MSWIWVILGLLLLVIGGEYLIRSSIALSFKLNLSKFIIGMTVVSFATSAPELIVSLNAALKGSPAIAINNVVGSNIANIGLVLGLTAMIGTIGVGRSFYRLNWPAMMLFSFALYFFLRNDNQLSRLEGFIFLTALILFLFILIKRTNISPNLDDVDDTLSVVSNFKIFLWLVIGGTALYFGSEWLVSGAISVAQALDVSEAVISVSMVALGTSIPELAASIMAAAKQERAISLGNLIGSNIFNIGSVLGITSLIKAIPLTDPSILQRDVIWMIAFALVLIPISLIPKRYYINRFKGFFLVLGYSFFIILVFVK